jgi:hypothetical protein
MLEQIAIFEHRAEDECLWPPPQVDSGNFKFAYLAHPSHRHWQTTLVEFKLRRHHRSAVSIHVALTQLLSRLDKRAHVKSDAPAWSACMHMRRRGTVTYTRKGPGPRAPTRRRRGATS